MDPTTTNVTIGCSAAANNSTEFSGGSWGTGSFCRAKQDTNTALTPIYAWVRYLTADCHNDPQDLSPDVSKPREKSESTLITKMASEQSLLPRIDFWYPLVQHQDHWYTTQQKYGHKKDDQSPRRYAKSRGIEGIEWQPSADIHKANAVEYQVNDGPKNMAFDL